MEHDRIMSIFDFIESADYRPTMEQEIDYNKYVQNYEPPIESVNTQQLVTDIPLAEPIQNASVVEQLSNNGGMDAMDMMSIKLSIGLGPLLGFLPN